MEPLLATKLFIPSIRPELVSRPRLIEQLYDGINHKLTILSAPAGFGKTTLVCEWLGNLQKDQGKETPSNHRIAWISLDEDDNDPTRFLAYIIAALTQIAGIDAAFWEGIIGLLQSPQPPPIQATLTSLINAIAAFHEQFFLILDDYHLIENQAAQDALSFLLENQPSNLHLVIATREDPHLPLSRLRARGQLTELRAADLRFTPGEAAAFLNQVMGLHLSAEDIAALEAHTEGWIAGLQLAAISMRGHQDISSFIKSFTGSHHFVMDYLVEEVLLQQPASIQAFLLHTAILDRLCGPLCDAVLHDSTVSGQETLEYLERANLFIVPLDNERRWYRYHHLFADLLRQRLQQQLRKHTASTAKGTEVGEVDLAELHRRASVWFEDNGLEFEAFQHAATAKDIERAERLTEGKGMPLHLRGAVTAILDWLASLPVTVLDARPSLWAKYAALLLVTGQTAGVEEKLDAAEAALAANLQGAELDDRTRNLVGQIAAARATLALTRYQVETMIAQSQRALEYLDANNLTFRTTAYWTMAFAHHLQGDRAAAGRAYTEALTISQTSGDIFSMILATSGLGQVQELENQLYLAAETHRHVLQLFGDHPQPNACEAHLGLARISYQWNDLDSAEQHAVQSLQLARQYDKVIDRFVISQVFLARLKLAQGDVAGAETILSEADQTTRQNHFVQRMTEVAAVQVLVLLRQGNPAAAAHLAQTYALPISQARVHLAQGNPAAALAVLEPYRLQMEARRWEDERLKVIVLQAVALYALGKIDQAVHILGEALALAEPGGFMRIFIDEGLPMAQLLSEASARGLMPVYVSKLLAAFEVEQQRFPAGLVSSPGKSEDVSDLSHALPEVHRDSGPLVEPLSQRELEILRLIAEGLSNHEICTRLFLALNTVKGHNRNIFDKLQVQSRTEAVARARQLGLL